MGLFKKKKKKELPPPPAPSEGPLPLPSFGDLGDIRSKKAVEVPELPPLPRFPPFKAKAEGSGIKPESELPPPRPLMPELELPAPREKEVFEKKITPVVPKRLSKPFVAVDDYKEIVSNSDIVREKLIAADNHLKRLEELEEDENKLLGTWRSYLEKVEKKMSFVDKIIAEAGEKK